MQLLGVCVGSTARNTFVQNLEYRDGHEVETFKLVPAHSVFVCLAGFFEHIELSVLCGEYVVGGDGRLNGGDVDGGDGVVVGKCVVAYFSRSATYYHVCELVVLESAFAYCCDI